MLTPDFPSYFNRISFKLKSILEYQGNMFKALNPIKRSKEKCYQEQMWNCPQIHYSQPSLHLLVKRKVISEC